MKRNSLLALLAVGHGFEHWYQALLGPIMPFLAQDLGLSLTQVGILITGRSVFSGFASVGAGIVTDAFGGGKWVLVFCMTGTALIHSGMSLFTTFTLLAPIFWISGLFTHSWHPPAMGFLGDQFRDRRGFALGIHGTGANIGQTLAPMVAGSLLLLMDWRAVLRVNIVPLLLVALLLMWFLPSFHFGDGQKKFSGGWLRQVSKTLLRNPALIGASIFSGLRTMAQLLVTIFLPFLLVREYDASPGWVGLALAVYAGASILPETAVGYLSDRLPRRFILFIGLLVGGLALLAIPYGGNGAILLVLLGGVGVFLNSLRSVLFAYSFEVTPSHLRGSVVGVMFTTNQVFVGLGSLVAGFLSDAFGPATAFWLGGGLVLVFLPMFFLMPNAASATSKGLVVSESGPATPVP